MAQTEQRTTRKRSMWDEQEDEMLRKVVQKFTENGEHLDWHRIASYIPGRNNKDCRKRWHYSTGAKVNKGSWQDAEDERLLAGVRKYGTRWFLVAQVVGTRNGDQCSKRWHDALNPDIDRSPWTPEEDRALIAATQKHGKLWRVIVDQNFPGRTSLSAKNRYDHLLRLYRKMKKKSSAGNANLSIEVLEKELLESQTPDVWGNEGIYHRRRGRNSIASQSSVSVDSSIAPEASFLSEPNLVPPATPVSKNEEPQQPPMAASQYAVDGGLFGQSLSFDLLNPHGQGLFSFQTTMNVAAAPPPTQDEITTQNSLQRALDLLFQDHSQFGSAQDHIPEASSDFFSQDPLALNPAAAGTFDSALFNSHDGTLGDSSAWDITPLAGPSRTGKQTEDPAFSAHQHFPQQTMAQISQLTAMTVPFNLTLSDESRFQNNARTASQDGNLGPSADSLYQLGGPQTQSRDYPANSYMYSQPPSNAASTDAVGYASDAASESSYPPEFDPILSSDAALDATLSWNEESLEHLDLSLQQTNSLSSVWSGEFWPQGLS